MGHVTLASVTPLYGTFDKFFKSLQFPTQVPISHVGFSRGFDMLNLPHYGAFDILVSQIPAIAPYKPEGDRGAMH